MRRKNRSLISEYNPQFAANHDESLFFFHVWQPGLISAMANQKEPLISALFNQIDFVVSSPTASIQSTSVCDYKKIRLRLLSDVESDFTS